MLLDIDPKAIEAVADEAVGPVGNVEYKQLMEKLGGTRRNRVFSFFGIKPPRREGEAVLAEAKEKKQQKAAMAEECNEDKRHNACPIQVES